MTEPDLLTRAVDLQRNGRFPEAEAAYRAILDQEPDRFDALHLLGVLALQTGRAEEGVRLVGAAIKINPGVAIAHKNRALGLANLGRYNEAVTGCETALALDPRYADAWALRAHALEKLGCDADAVASYDRALALRPSDADAHLRRADALFRLGRFAEAAAGFDSAIAATGPNAALYLRLGTALNEVGEHARALDSFDRAIALDPRNADIHNNRGFSLQGLGRFQEAVDSYGSALALKPDFIDAYLNRCVALSNLRRHRDSLADCDAVLALDPGNVKALNNRGAAHYNLGQHDQALRDFQAALAIAPDHAEVHVSLAYVLLLLGRYEEGWREYEWRKRTRSPLGHRSFPQPAWLGQPDLAGKHLFVHWEQGMGDIVQMCRYLPIVRAMAGKVTLSVPERMTGLMRGLDPAIEVIGGWQAPPSFDLHCPIMSLPLALGSTLGTIPSSPRYLRPDPVASARWQARLGRHDRPQVGIVWRGNPKLPYDRIRSMQFQDVLPLLDANVRFICLQAALEPDTDQAVRRDGRIEIPGQAIQPLEETAALVTCLDLVITVDTFFAHLAGALGKPVWVMLPFTADWRWLTDRADSPWYPSARLFRQDSTGTWAPVVASVARALHGLVARQW